MNCIKTVWVAWLLNCSLAGQFCNAILHGFLWIFLHVLYCEIKELNASPYWSVKKGEFVYKV